MEIGRKFSNQGLIEDYEEVKWRRVTKKELNIEDSEAKKREIQKTLSTPQRRALERVNSMSPTPGKQAARNLSPLLNKSHTQAHFTQNERKGDYSPNRPLRVVKEDTEPKRRNFERSKSRGNSIHRRSAEEPAQVVINPIKHQQELKRNSTTPQKLRINPNSQNNPFYQEIGQNFSPFNSKQQPTHHQSVQPNFHFNQHNQNQISPYKSNPQFPVFQNTQNHHQSDLKENQFRNANQYYPMQNHQNYHQGQNLKKPVLGEIPIKKDSNRNADFNELQKIYYHNDGIPVTPNTTFDQGAMTSMMTKQGLVISSGQLRPEVLNITRNSELESPQKFGKGPFGDQQGDLQINLNANTENGNNLILNIDPNAEHLESIAETVSYKTGNHLNRGSIEQPPSSTNHFSSLNQAFLTQQSLNQNSLNNLKSLTKKHESQFSRNFDRDQNMLHPNLHENISFTTSKHTTSYNYTFQDKENSPQQPDSDFVDHKALERIEEFPPAQRMKKKSAWEREKAHKGQHHVEPFSRGFQEGYPARNHPNPENMAMGSYDQFIQQKIGNVQYDFFPN
jgi:hypothetical protein